MSRTLKADMMVMMRRYFPYVVALAAILPLSLGGCASFSASQVQHEHQQRARQYVEQANQYMSKGMLDSALAAFGLALEENPELIQAAKGMGQIYRKRGDYKLASHAYERAVKINPTDFNAQYYLGLMRQLMGEVEQAITAYLQALAINPNDADANRDLAAAYLQIGRSGEALPYAQRATKLSPDSQSAWYNLAAAYSLLGQYDKAVDAYRQAAELGKLADEVMLGLADAHLQLGNYQRAINVLHALLRRNPSATAYERLGYADFKQREFDEALVNYRKALDLDPNETAALNGAGAVLMTQYIQDGRNDTAKRDQAVEDWRKSLQLRPNQPRIVDLLSRYSRL